MLKLLSAIFFSFPMVATAAETNLREQFSEGGIALVVILLMSILLVAVSAERLVNFRTKTIFSSDLVARIRPLWLAGDFDKIHELLESEKNTLGRILNYLLCHRHQQVSVLALGASEIASLELRQHQQKAYALAIVATVAPIVGLLGTVIGMIEAFHVIAYSQGMGNPALLAGGISKALINTAAGLSVALPALAMHHFFKHRSVMFSLLLEQTINQRINEWFTSTHADSVPNLKVVSHAN
jgi:biopolymer transport protein ExbB